MLKEGLKTGTGQYNHLQNNPQDPSRPISHLRSLLDMVPAFSRTFMKLAAVPVCPAYAVRATKSMLSDVYLRIVRPSC
jgi:hypothetical protein